MAELNAFKKFDTYNQAVWYGSILEATNTHISISDGYFRGDYYGSFQYYNGDLASGSVTNYDFFIGGVAQYSVVGASLDAKTVQNFLSLSDAYGLMAWVFKGIDAIYGSPFNDVLSGFAGNDQILGGAGNDQIQGGAGNDSMWGDAGNDSMRGNDSMWGDAGNDSMWGDAGNDQIVGGAGNDSMWGDAGNDFMWGEAGSDLIVGGAGNDLMYGDAGNDSMVGDAGNDLILGDAGEDILAGRAGNDQIQGGAGKDFMYGDAGKDLLTGGAGQDQFVFDSKLGLSNIDTITDYKVGLGGDTLALDTIIFKSLAGITDVTKNFIVGSKALDGNDYLIFNPKTSVLSYDANGSGAGGAVGFVILTGIHALDSAEFSIYSS